METVQDVNDNIDAHNENAEATLEQRREGISTSAVYPMAGAVLGTCLGGPVGFLAGVKIGGLAAVGGSLFGKTASFCMQRNIFNL